MVLKITLTSGTGFPVIPKSIYFNLQDQKTYIPTIRYNANSSNVPVLSAQVTTQGPFWYVP
jgi:hypothetical protein